MFCFIKTFPAIIWVDLGLTVSMEHGCLQLEPQRRAPDSAVTTLPFNLALDNAIWDIGILMGRRWITVIMGAECFFKLSFTLCVKAGLDICSWLSQAVILAPALTALSQYGPQWKLRAIIRQFLQTEWMTPLTTNTELAMKFNYIRCLLDCVEGQVKWWCQNKQKEPCCSQC